jgi:hypothetical protein
VVEELNETLQDAGQLTITSQASKYNLPADLLQQIVEARLGTLCHGQLKNGELYTEAFVTRHNARVRGAFTGLTRPTPFRTVVQQFQFQDSLARSKYLYCQSMYAISCCYSLLPHICFSDCTV